MKFNALIPQLSVSDINRTKAFYVDTLGFSVAYERPEDRFLFVCMDGCQLMLEQFNDHWHTGELVYPFGRGINLQMSVHDVEGLYNRVLQAGLVPFVPLHSVSYRNGDDEIIQRQFLIQDPDGYLLRFTD